ncbi:NitT/TauT family transport system substrate-binding protein [Humitalea rosea]|uniref:NitT/TauT family transport system substrate-binding protein n=1 Tax=Humitalea rosea TaxID=990373 RepID=A0A2W7IF97_9PROT|nr:ABC transporter substrate-binding protein [Humitalea rosea]PZW44758.1 NitT/TauT family transport system substrate-binding protein [Humitalea rosea]
MTQITRRAALTLAALPLAAPPLLGQNLTKLRVSVIPVLDVAPLHAAIREGYFAAEGIEIDTSTTTGGATGLPGLIAGQFQVTFSNTVSILLGVREGLDFRFVSGASRGAMTPPDIFAVMAKKGSGIRSGKDLEGKRIASNTRNNIVWLRGMAWVEKTGGDWHRVTTVEVPFPQMADALAGGRIDAAILSEPFVAGALATHGDTLERIGWPISETAPGGTNAQYVAMKDELNAHGEVFDRFGRALHRGVDWVNARLTDPVLLELIAGFSRVPIERLRQVALPAYPKGVTPGELDDLLVSMKHFGMTGTYPATSSLIFRTAAV